MASIDYVNYTDRAQLAAGHLTKPRLLEFYVDFTDTGNQVAAAADSINLCELPKGTVVLSAGQEQMVAGSAGSTTTVRVGTVAFTSTLASDAAVGTHLATADVSGGHPYIVASAVDFNLLVGTDVRATGKVRAWIVVQESQRPTGAPKLAARDTSTGLA